MILGNIPNLLKARIKTRRNLNERRRK